MDDYNQEELFAETVLAAQNRADYVTLELEFAQPKFKGKDGSPSRRKIEPWCLPVSIIAFLVILLVCIPLFGNEKGPEDISKNGLGQPCNDTCNLSFRSSILSGRNRSFFTGKTDLDDLPDPNGILNLRQWIDLSTEAGSSVDMILSQSKFEELQLWKMLPPSATIKIRIILIVQNAELNFNMTNLDTILPSNQVEIRRLNIGQTNSLLHSLPEMILVDQLHMSLSTQIVSPKTTADETDESIGNNWVLYAENCSCGTLMTDVQKVFLTYWTISGNPVDNLQSSLSITSFRDKNLPLDPFNSAFAVSMTAPLAASSTTLNALVYSHNPDQRISTGLLPVLPYDLLSNVEAICAVLQASRQFLDILVVNYHPEIQTNETHLNSSDASQRSFHYWPVIDNAIRQAVVSRRLKVRMLVLEDSNLPPQRLERSTVSSNRHLWSLKVLDGLNDNTLQIKIMNLRSLHTTASQQHQSSGTMNSPTAFPSQFSLAGNIVVTANAAYYGTSSFDGDSLTKLPGMGITVLPSDFCQEHSSFCSTIRSQREALASLHSEKPIGSSRASGSARLTAQPLHRGSLTSRTAKDQPKAPPRLSASQLALQHSFIHELTTLFDIQWNHPDAYEL